MPLFQGGVFNKDYNSKYKPISFVVPSGTSKVELVAVITGHGSDNNNCCEFCVTSHHFVINGNHSNVLTFSDAGTEMGCADRVAEGVVPNEHGTWLYGRGGWCDGFRVDPWVVDVTKQVNFAGNNSIIYFGWYNGQNPNPIEGDGTIVMYSEMVFWQ